MRTVTQKLPRSDIDVLRSLAEKRAALADDPVNRERRQAWYALDSGEGNRPMVLADPWPITDRNPPFSEDVLVCEHDEARKLEKELRRDFYRFEVLKDDHPIEPYVNVGWQVQCGDMGVEVVTHRADNDGHLASMSWDPPIKDFGKDFPKLHHRSYHVDREATLARKAWLESVFGGILEVRLRGKFFWTSGLTWTAIDLIGLENLMFWMIDAPDDLHQLMGFLRDDLVSFCNFLEKEELWTLTNENDYNGSGSVGYTHDLPRRDRAEGEPVRMKDLWILSESQETVGVGPDQFEEFVFPYQMSLVERFGKTYYGCCEPLHSRWHVIRKIPNLARVSVSPWADQERMAEGLGRDYVFSRKPNPVLVSTEVFNEEAIRKDLRHTLEVAGACRLELIMKDVHTLNEEPDRLPRWVQFAREEIDRLG